MTPDPIHRLERGERPRVALGERHGARRDGPRGDARTAADILPVREARGHGRGPMCIGVPPLGAHDLPPRAFSRGIRRCVIVGHRGRRSIALAHRERRRRAPPFVPPTSNVQSRSGQSALTGDRSRPGDFIRLGRDMEGASGGAGGGDPSPQGGVMTMGRKDLVEIKRRLLQVRAANPSRVTDDRVAPAHRSRCFPGYFFPSARAPRPDDALAADLSVASLDPNAARGSEPGGVLEPRLRVPTQAGVEG